jgi:hypothetical protein
MSQTYRPPRPVTGIALLFTLIIIIIIIMIMNNIATGYNLDGRGLIH